MSNCPFFGFYLHLFTPLKWYQLCNQGLKYGRSALNVKQPTSLRVVRHEILPPRLFSISMAKLILRQETCTPIVFAHTRRNTTDPPWGRVSVRIKSLQTGEMFDSALEAVGAGSCQVVKGDGK